MSTQIQSDISEVLQKLKFEFVDSDLSGGPQEFRVSDATVDFLKTLVDIPHAVVVESNGNLRLKKPK